MCGVAVCSLQMLGFVVFSDGVLLAVDELMACGVLCVWRLVDLVSVRSGGSGRIC